MDKIKNHSICFIATVPDVLFSFMKAHIKAAEKEMNVAMVSSLQRSELLADLNARFIAMDIQRKISFWADLKALIQLLLFFRKGQFDIVHSIMPKTGLLAMMASWFTRVPCRIHTFTGQVWANKRGFKRTALKFFDRAIVLFSTHIIVDSPSQRAFLEAERILRPGEGIVIGQGSICGVDLTRFHPDDELRQVVRRELGLQENQVMILYLGRLNKDKGVIDLAHAIKELSLRKQNVMLVCVGNEEDVLFAGIENICASSNARLIKLPFTAHPERYMVAADLFCLPSYREGFGQVIIEAAACGVPSVASRIYGITDAVEDGKTGLLFPSGDVDALADALSTLIDNSELRKRMGLQAKDRAFEKFDSRLITDGQMQIYRNALLPRLNS